MSMRLAVASAKECTGAGVIPKLAAEAAASALGLEFA